MLLVSNAGVKRRSLNRRRIADTHWNRILCADCNDARLVPSRAATEWAWLFVAADGC